MIGALRVNTEVLHAVSLGIAFLVVVLKVGFGSINFHHVFWFNPKSSKTQMIKFTSAKLKKKNLSKKKKKKKLSKLYLFKNSKSRWQTV